MPKAFESRSHAYGHQGTERSIAHKAEVWRRLRSACEPPSGSWRRYKAFGLVGRQGKRIRGGAAKRAGTLVPAASALQA